MCSTCGCGQPDEKYTISKPGEQLEGIQPDADIHGHHHNGHGHNHNDHHHHHHDHHHPNQERLIELEQDILQKNNLLAERNRGYLEAKEIFCINLVSSPGSGKTALLERTIQEHQSKFDFFIIEGDQQTMNDANRIEATGAPVVQINTGMGCHLDAAMVNQAIKKLNPAPQSILFIENVGNLVCPSLFDLGEQKRVVIMSVTEGEDKPVKYPTMFQSSQLCIINKVDLAPYVDFNRQKAIDYAMQVNHHLEIIELSVKTGEGMNNWYDWLTKVKQV